jgi:hypothetical protein
MRMARFDESQFNDTAWNIHYGLLYNKDVVEKYGLHDRPMWLDGSQPSLGLELGEEPVSQSLSDAITQCSAQAARLMPPNPIADDMGAQLSEAITAGEKEAYFSKEIEAAGLRWTQCMEPLAIPGMPSSPLGDEIYDNLIKTLRLWPTLGLSMEFSLDEESPVGDKEMSIARKDFECRESSGFTHEYYIKRWDYQSKQLAENPELADALEKTTALVEETMSKLRVMIAEHEH